MDITHVVLGTVTATATLAILALVVYRPWNKTKRRLQGHGLETHVETDVRNMHIPAGVEAPFFFWIPGDPPPPAQSTMRWGNADWAEWAYSHGGNDVTTSVIQVTIQGGGEGPLSVEAPELVGHRAVARSADGAVYGPEGVGGNGIHSRRYVFRLDGETSVREYLEDPDERPESFGMAKGETQRLLIVVSALDDKRHLFGLEIPVIHAGRRTTLKIRRASGEPFVVYGGKTAPVKMLVDGEWFESPAPLY